MNFENLKYNKCPQCDITFLEKDIEYILDEEDKKNGVTDRVFHHKPCGFKMMEGMYKMSLEQAAKELEAIEAIDKIDMTPGLFRLFSRRYLLHHGKWKVKGIFMPQVVRNNRPDASPDDFFLAIPFKADPPKEPKGIKRAVNQGKRRGFTKPLRKKKSN